MTSTANPARAVVTWLRRAWHWLTSMRTALILLFLLALAAIPGALLPQRQVSASLVDDYLAANPTLGPIYDRLQFFDVFSSTWFVAIVTLLMVSLVGCIIPRSVDHWRAYNTPPTRAPKYLTRMPLYADGLVEGDQGSVDKRVREALPRWHTATYEPSEDRAGAFSISAERGYTRELMNLLFHIGLVGMIVAFAAGRMVFYEGQVIVVTNSSSPFAVPVDRSREFCNTSPANFDVFRAGSLVDGTRLTPFCIESQNFNADYLNNGQAASFTSLVSYTDDLAAPKSEWSDFTLSVNNPLRIGGDRVYLQGHGFAPQITVTWPNGESRTQLIQFRPTDLMTFLSSGVMRFDPPAGMYPDLKDRRANQLAIEGVFAPTAQWSGLNNDTLASSFAAMENPAMAVELYVGDAGLDTGRPQNIFVLDQQLIADGRLRKVERLNLEPGEEVSVDIGDGGPVTVRFDGAAEYANYQISRDPFQGWTLAATTVMLASLAASLAIKRRRVWVRVTPAAGAGVDGVVDGVVRVEIAGLARTDRAGWSSEFTEIADTILGAGGDRTKSPSSTADDFDEPDL